MNATIHPIIHTIVYIICSKLYYPVHIYNHNYTALYALARSMKYNYVSGHWLERYPWIYLRIYITHNMSQYCVLSV